VGYTLAYPPGYDKGDRLPLALVLHAYGGNHQSDYGRMTLAEALALRPGGRPLMPMAMISPDGGNLYWHPHPGDDPMGMLLHEIIPMCEDLGLGRAADGNEIVATGISMGGYGALLIAEQQPSLISAVSVMSPAIWNTYSESLLAGGACWTSQADFEANDATGGASALAGRPVRIACGQDDPFHGYVEVLQAALPRGSAVVYPPGGHNATFWAAEAPAALGYLSAALAQRAACRSSPA
jgi:pimeloyl-ACP methyl ester carboxylesterase